MRHDVAEEILHSHAAIHDRSQFEVKFTYDVSAANISESKSDERYRIEAFYFFPTNMGITALNFPKEAFYRSLHGYVRFKTPEITAQKLLDPLDRKSPLNVLSFYLKRLTLGQGRSDAAMAANEAKLFGCMVSSLLRAHQSEVRYLLSRAKRRSGEAGRWLDLEGFLFDFLNSMTTLLTKYRELMRDFRSLAMRIDPDFLARLRQVDEYLTYRLDDTLSAIHFQLASVWEAPERTAVLIARLQEVAEAEASYRQLAGYVQLTPADESVLALYTYRASALKKLVEQVLYLDVKTVQETNRWRNLAAMFGAMLAAVLAGYSDRSFIWELNKVNLWLAVMAFAFVYVVKDRVKEVLREYVWVKVARFFPDNRHMIHDPVKRLDIGKTTERTRYLAKKHVPKDVLSVRNINHTIDLDEEREETVIVYQNDVSLNAREILAEHSRRADIKHILRFSVEDLLARMDDPTVRVQFYDGGSQAFCRLRAPKVYHLNVVFRFTRWDDRNRQGQPHYQRIRVILDKNGIQRIEPVVEGCTLGELMMMTRRAEEEALLVAEEQSFL